ncbi:hypothetical protein DPEC_G00242210 [Dallia pectoralis]|uniref:Uncharacterized protein n=1 Tax=Dallia pectoralis TaxID=75939 RepID=A0ACC2FUY1_DALPE|nr:hypothetical protein DPEC_G00242210 [Dallia pectoralis]
MKAHKQVTKQNGEASRRPSYPGDQRVKHANLTTQVWVKVAMAVAYFLCVSITALVLAIYYVFFWSPDPASGRGVDNVTSTPARVIFLRLFGNMLLQISVVAMAGASHSLKGIGGCKSDGAGYPLYSHNKSGPGPSVDRLTRQSQTFPDRSLLQLLGLHSLTPSPYSSDLALGT